MDELVKILPLSIRKTKTIERYIEPFVGGGAIFFHLKSNFTVKNSFLFDINRELIISYKVIKNDPKKLIKELKTLEKKYIDKSEEEREKFYYKIRNKYNDQMNEFDYQIYSETWINRAKLLIFLNKTCYNGLFRQNKKGEFNVPFGRYKNPTICDAENIGEAHRSLKDAKVFYSDFTESGQYIEKGSFVYLDPPYRPISGTSNFTSYAKEDFNDNDQKRLATFFKKMDEKGAYLLLSNSDPKNEDPEDAFFDELYANYTIERVPAKRYINCDASNRGEINELVIRNY